MKAYERLLSYVRVFTPSDENSYTSPSSTCQFDLARMLVRELQELGVADASVDEHCYVYGHIPATPDFVSNKKLGFIAHMDTVSDFCDHEVTPVLTRTTMVRISHWEKADGFFPRKCSLIFLP